MKKLVLTISALAVLVSAGSAFAASNLLKDTLNNTTKTYTNAIKESNEKTKNDIKAKQEAEKKKHQDAIEAQRKANEAKRAEFEKQQKAKQEAQKKKQQEALTKFQNKIYGN